VIHGADEALIHRSTPAEAEVTLRQLGLTVARLDPHRHSKLWPFFCVSQKRLHHGHIPSPFLDEWHVRALLEHDHLGVWQC
jgi:hypothetical protein